MGGEACCARKVVEIIEKLEQNKRTNSIHDLADRFLFSFVMRWPKSGKIVVPGLAKDGHRPEYKHHCFPLQGIVPVLNSPSPWAAKLLFLHICFHIWMGCCRKPRDIRWICGDGGLKDWISRVGTDDEGGRGSDSGGPRRWVVIASADV